MYIQNQNKQLDKLWINAECLLKVDTSKSITISNSSVHNISSLGWSIALVLQPDADCSISKKTTNGWSIECVGGVLTFSIHNGSSLTISTNIVVGKLTHVVCYYTTAGKIGIIINGTNVVETSTTLTGTFTDTTNIVISGSCLTGFISIYNKALSLAEVSYLYNEIGIISKSLHGNCVGYWTVQEKYGNKAYDSVEQFNYLKPYLTPSALQMSLWGKTTDASGRYTFTQESDGMKVLNTADIAANGMAAGSWYYYSVLEGVGDIIAVIDVEKTSTNVNDKISFGFNYNAAQWIHKTAIGRETLTTTYTITNSQFFCEFQLWATSSTVPRTADNLGFKIYSIKLYKKSTGEPITPTHGDLVGYTDTELGIPTKTTQTARVDIYDKATTSFWNGSGNDIKSGLPELKNALYCARVGSEFLVRCPVETPITSIGTGDFSWHISVYIPDFITDDRVFYFRSGNWQVLINKESVQVYQSFSGLGLYLINTLPTKLKGFNTISFIRHSSNRYICYLNGRRLFFSLSGGNVTGVKDTFINTGTPTIVEGSATPWNLTDLWYIVFPNYNNYIVNFGIRTGIQTMQEHCSIHNNGLFRNPTSLASYKAYYQFDTAGTTPATDETGNQTAAFTDGTSLTISTINNLR